MPRTARSGNLRLVGYLSRHGYQRGRVPPALSAYSPPHVFDADAVRCRVGAQVCGAGMTWPLGTATLDDAWLLVAGTFGPPAWIDRGVVAQVRSFPWVMTRGVMFDTPDGRYDGVIVWAGRRSTFCGTLASRGWPIVS